MTNVLFQLTMSIHKTNASSLFLICFLFYLLVGCTSRESKIFTLLPAGETNIHFENTVEDTPEFNILNYLYFYDGGGVSVGDINNDGLADIYFSANVLENKLYLNKGDLQFEDITAEAAVGGGTEGWTTGTAMVDVNRDGWLDIYVCRVNYRDKKGANQLFINNGDNTFTEQAGAYGLDFRGYSVQPSFFDYDKDGDLDLYLLNHAVHTPESYGHVSIRNKRDSLAGDRLYRNDGQRFTDVTEQSGIYSSPIGYGLSASVSDVNNDGWPDIYVANDFHEDDRLYFNNGDGTFTDRLRQSIQHTSRASMGSDIADFNNDGLMDILSLDMMPKDEAIFKKSGGFDTYEVSNIKKDFGYYHQFGKNALQLNRGVMNSGYPIFSEIAYLAGIYATDWSWAGLFADLDNDGLKDIYITNGIYRRPNDLDFIDLYMNEQQRMSERSGNDQEKKLIEKMPSVEISNVAFENSGGLTFEDATKEWGLEAPSFSNGAAYVDLDNDGDLELVVNNVNGRAFVYKNLTREKRGSNYLRVDLMGSPQNSSGIGAKVKVYASGRLDYKEQYVSRGFQSSVDHVLHFGLDTLKAVDSLVVIWPDDKYQKLNNLKANQTVELQWENAQTGGGGYVAERSRENKPFFEVVSGNAGINYKHRENPFNDFEHEVLLPHMLSVEGPRIAKADVNGDGLEDFYIGGAASQSGKLYLQQPEGGFEESKQKVFVQDRISEDTDAAFFDANGDGHPDLYVASGGNQLFRAEIARLDRLYLNDGKGNFEKAFRLPTYFLNGSVVAPYDIDSDGDVDLFVGSRNKPMFYGISPRSQLLINDGNGNFADKTEQLAPELVQAGMVTDAIWADIDGDKQKDLVVAGEWMPIKVFRNSGDKLTEITAEAGFNRTDGWWNRIIGEDFDKDGDIDFVAGNLGRNSILKASVDEPVELFLNDFDDDMTIDPIITHYNSGIRYPFATLDELKAQIESLDKRYSTYAEFGDSRIEEIFDHDKLEGAVRKQAYTFESIFAVNDGTGKFTIHPLPVEAQFSPIFVLLPGDFNKDGNLDILAGGNFHGVKPVRGRYDANYGTLLLGNGNGSFKAIQQYQTGIHLTGQLRDGERLLQASGNSIILLSQNNDSLVVLQASQWNK